MNKNLYVLALVALLLSCRDKKNLPEAAAATAETHAGHGMDPGPAGYCDSVNNGLIRLDTLKGSPERSAMNSIGKTHVHIEYCSPGVKERVIWGGLVPYGNVWVTGAHHASTIRFYKDVVIEGNKVPKGLYAVFTIPGKDEWIFILNTRTEQHLADDYQQKEDLLRVTVKPEAHAPTARLTYSVTPVDATHGIIRMAWEKVAISVPFETI